MLMDTGSMASASLREQAERYYAAFPALSGKLEPSEKSEVQHVEILAKSVWVTKKQQTNTEHKNNETTKDEEEDESEESKQEDCNTEVVEEDEGIKMEENRSFSKQATGNRVYFKMKNENDKKTSKLHPETWGAKVAEEAVFSDATRKKTVATRSHRTATTILPTLPSVVQSPLRNMKPSFIVPKCRTTSNSRRHPKMVVVKGKSPFTVAKPKTTEFATTRYCKRKTWNTVKRYPIVRQHSEENTEESSSLDNSFDEDVPVKPKLASEQVRGKRIIKVGGTGKNVLPNDARGCHGDSGQIGEAEVLAKLAAKFNDRVAAIWSDQKAQEETKGPSTVDNIWQVLPFCGNQQTEAEPLTPPAGLTHDLKSLFASLNEQRPEVACSVWLNPLSERPVSPGKQEPSAALPTEDSLANNLKVEPINKAVDSRGFKVEANDTFDNTTCIECETVFSTQLYEDLVKNNLWKWQTNRGFIQGGVYGTAPELQEQWRAGKELGHISLAELDLQCCTSPSSQSEEDSLLESEPESVKCSTPSHDDEMQLVWEILGKLGNTLQRDSEACSPGGSAVDEDDGILSEQTNLINVANNLAIGIEKETSQASDAYLSCFWTQPLSKPHDKDHPCQLTQMDDKLIDLKAIWNSMHDDCEDGDSSIHVEVLTPHLQPLLSSEHIENDVQGEWSTGDLGPCAASSGGEFGTVSLTRSYDSYLNKVLREKEQEESSGNNHDSGNAFRSEPSLFTYHKGESRFVEVKPTPKSICWPQSQAPPPPPPPPPPPQSLVMPNMLPVGYDAEEEAHENLLTSPKTHFRPIRQDSCETDTTTGCSETSEEQAAVSATIPPDPNLIAAAVKVHKDDLYKLHHDFLIASAACKLDDADDSSDELGFFPSSSSSKSKTEKFCQTENRTNANTVLNVPEQCENLSDAEQPDDEEDSCTQILNAVIDVLDCMLSTRGIMDHEGDGNDDDDDEEEDEYDCMSESSSTSVSPVSSKDDNSQGSVSDLDMMASLAPIHMCQRMVEERGIAALELDNMYGRAERDPWSEAMERSVLKQEGETAHPHALQKWSTAQEEHPFWLGEDEDDDTVQKVPWGLEEHSLGHGLDNAATDVIGLDEMGNVENCSVRHRASTKIKTLREEIKDEEEQLFDDIDHLRILDSDEAVWDDSGGSSKDQKMSQRGWLLSDDTSPMSKQVLAENVDEDECPELEMINNQRLDCSSSDGDDEGAAFADGVMYSDYFFELQNAEDLGGAKLPVVPTSKALYSADLEEEWRKNVKPFDVQIPKNKFKQKFYHHKRPCSFYLEGNCRRSDCKFSHDLASITCRFWEEGSCFKGITCPFLHGYRSYADKENNEDKKSGFKLELESETHFPALAKPKTYTRKQDLCHSSSSDSMPMTQNRRRRKRCPGRHRASSPTGRQPLVKYPKQSRQLLVRKKQSKGSSNEDDTMDI